MIKRKTRHGIIFLTSLSIIIWLLPRSSSDPVNEPPARLDTRLNYALRDFNGQLLDQQGNITLQISSPLLRKVAESEVATIKSPQLWIKQPEQQWHITAESAIITADREYISLIGDVNMLRLNEISGETLKITTRDVLLRVTPRTASTESFVTIVQYGNRLDALGMNLDMANDNFELLKDVRAHYDIP
ncbi:MAG: LPS export ABC transporter periplasmic protein LptC [Xanthomonadales bacterium]